MKVIAMTLLMLCAMAYFGVSPAAAEGANTGIQCQCGGFNKKEVKPADKPLMVQNPLNTTCDAKGQTTCLTMCLELAKISEGRGPEILCGFLKEANNLKPSMFVRVCDKPWVYSGLSLEKPICCKNSAVIPCVATTTTKP